MITQFRNKLTLCSLLVVSILPAIATAAGDDREPTVVEDAHFGEVLFYFYQEDYFPAIVHLLAAQKKSQLENHVDESELLLGGLYLSYGHHQRAAQIFEQMLADNVDSDVRDRTWFFLAKIWQQRGYLAEAEAALARIENELPEPLEEERHMLYAQLLIDKGQHNQAIAMLQDWRGNSVWAEYAKFNLGVAMVRSGQVNGAASILNDLGELNPINEELSSLRDKANLALGYAYLQDGQPQAARAPLQRVRLEGPFSSKALLGVGWADAEVENFQRALVPWMELRGRNILDPAVQESMLAVPYAFAQLRSRNQAADHYLNALEAFAEESQRIDEAVARIESGELMNSFLDQDPTATTGWYWRLEELPDGPDAQYLYHLLATHKFQEGLKNYRDLHYLWTNLDDWTQRVGVYRNMLDTRKAAYDKRLPSIQASLAKADIDGMVDAKLNFDARLNQIEESKNSLALATNQEHELWQEITAIENNPALTANIPEAAEVRDKLRLLKGALQWNLDREYNGRLSKIRRELQKTGEALVATKRSRRQIDEKMRTEPLLFAEFDARVSGLSPQVDNVMTRVELAMLRQRGFMQGIAAEELRAQKQRIETYSVQARFALAALYDATAPTVGDATQ